jgi:hypothetical protein
MIKFKLTKKVPLALLFLIIAVFVGQYFLFKNIKEINEKSSSLAQEIELKKNRENYMISTGKIIQNKSKDIELVKNSIVSNVGDVEFIGNLERMAYQNNLSIEIKSLYLESNSKSTTSPIAILRIGLKTTGSWFGTYKFLKEVESMQVKTKINSYAFQNENNNVSSQDTPSYSGKWESLVDISVLKYK